MAEFVTYKTKDKTYKIPKEVMPRIKKDSEKLKMSLKDTVEMYIANGNEGYIEQMEIEQKAKEYKRENVVSGKRKKETKPRTVTYTDEELNVVAIVKEALEKAEIGVVTQEKTKSIDLTYNGIKFTINVVKHRPPKE